MPALYQEPVGRTLFSRRYQFKDWSQQAGDCIIELLAVELTKSGSSAEGSSPIPIRCSGHDCICSGAKGWATPIVVPFCNTNLVLRLLTIRQGNRPFLPTRLTTSAQRNRWSVCASSTCQSPICT